MANNQTRAEAVLPSMLVATTSMEIDRPLGRGGLGDIYEARDRGMGRTLAVKFLNDWALDQPACREAFSFEAKVTSQLEHPNIVPVYATGSTDEGRPFYAMRLIPGRTLAAAIADFHDTRHGEQVSERHAARYRELLGQFALVCKAIAFAHDRGVIHRDIKPANVMLGRFGEVVVLDWGLAARIDRDDRARSSGEQSIVMPTVAIGDEQPAAKRGLSGTPAYMSPEQHDGARHVGAASDVYGLGATLYHILTGQPPFDGELPAIREQAIAGKVMAPSRVKRGVSQAIESICMKAMARDPVDRYESPLDLARDIDNYLADLPVSSYREPLRRTIARWTRRHRSLAQMGVAALLLLLLTAGASALLLHRMANEEYRARQTALLMAARLAASTAGLQIDARWRILEHEAQSPALVEAIVAAASVEPAPEDGRRPWIAVQAALDGIAAANRDAVDAESWSVCNAKGVQIARWPLADTIGQSFSHRDYFHGGEAGLKPGTPTEPLKEVHRSSVYESAATGRLKVAFSAPIWREGPGGTGRTCIGVLVMAFDVGVLFRSIDAIGGWNAAKQSYSVAVIDLRNDEVEGRQQSGLVLENPDIVRADLAGPTKVQYTRAPSAIVTRLKAASQRKPEFGKPPGLNDGTAIAFDAEVPTIAAAEPIVILGRPEHLANIGWAVLVHER